MVGRGWSGRRRRSHPLLAFKPRPPAKRVKEKTVVAVINTGGTIGMRETLEGLTPKETFTPPQGRPLAVKQNVELKFIDLFRVDSSEMTLAHSRALVEKIVKLQNDPRVAGIVVVHGTDTLASTAHEIGLTIKRMRKPIVITGSQLPADHPQTDAGGNFWSSVALAASNPELKTVAICFGAAGEEADGSRKVYHWRNADKTFLEEPDAFYSPSAKQMLAPVSAKEVKKTKQKTAVEEDDKPAYAEWGFARISRVPLERHTTGLTEINATKTAGIIVEAYGSGNIPKRALETLLKKVEEKQNAALKTNKDYLPVVVASSAHGIVDLTKYAPGFKALKAGFLPASDLRPATASKRLSWLLARAKSIKIAAAYAKIPYKDLFNALFLSGSQFGSEETRAKHAETLGVPIIEKDLLADVPLSKAMQTAANAILDLKEKEFLQSLEQEKRFVPAKQEGGYSQSVLDAVERIKRRENKPLFEALNKARKTLHANT